MNIFEHIPGNFFSVLSSKNKELYVDALMLLHRLFRHELNIEREDYISALVQLLGNRCYEVEEDDEVSSGSLDLRTQAYLILTRFVKTGWVDRENLDGTYIEVITPRSYAIQVMQLLYDLGNESTREYNSLVFSTYSSLKEAFEHHPEQIYEAVLNARANTEKLMYELKSLYHGIRGYLRKIQGQKDVNMLLRDHFDQYKALTDRIYHPIKTMDSVYRYMTPIRSILTEILGSPAILEDMTKRAMSIRRYTREEAVTEIINSIDYVLDVFQSLGHTVNEIDKKHSSYTKLSIDTIRYHMSADQTMTGQLVTLLRGYSALPESKQQRMMNALESNVRINRQDFIDGRSLWHKNARSRSFSTEPLEINEDARLSEDEAENLMRTLSSDYSLEHILRFMDTQFGTNDTVSTEEMDIVDDREFIMLLLATIRAGERRADFKAQPKADSLIINGYRVPKIVFTRKGGANKHVV